MLQRISFCLWALGLVGGIFLSEASADIIITEILYNPDGSDTEVSNKEWVEIYNTGSAAADLSGWTIEDIQDGSVASALPNGTMLGPGEALVLTGDSADFDRRWNQDRSRSVRRIQVDNFPSFANSPSLSNETVGLRNNRGRIVDSVNYDDDGKIWPLDEPDGGSIMVRPEGLSPQENDNGRNWIPTMDGVYGGRHTQVGEEIDRASPGFVATVPQSHFEPSADVAWSMVVIPDTQNYVSDSSRIDVFDQMTQWIADHHEEFGIEFVLHEGDIVNQNDLDTPKGSGDQNSPQQWQSAKNAMSTLDGVVPYAFSPGNHDYGIGNAEDRSTHFNEYFKPSDNPLVNPVHGGTLKSVKTAGELDNSLHAFTAPDGRDMMIVTTEWDVQQETLDWANQAISRGHYSNHTGILVTHSYINGSDSRSNLGKKHWEGLVSPNEGFEMVFNGHYGNDGIGYLVSEGEQDQIVHQMFFNAQHQTYGGNGLIRLVEFLEDGRTVRIRTFSTLHDLEKMDEANRFEFTITPLLAGDYNDDDIVNTADYTVWRDQWGQEVAAWSAADGDGNGFIDNDDLEVWKANYGFVRDAIISVNSQTSVPEPCSTALLFASLSIASCFTLRRARAKQVGPSM